MTNHERRLGHPGWEIISNDYQLVELALLAEYFHSDDEDYHNFGHILDTLLYARAEIERYEAEESVRLPSQKIYKGLILHDTLVHIPLEPNGRYPSVEHRSASLAAYILSELGDSEEDIADITRWIINTNKDYPCEPYDEAAKIFCRADIGNIADTLPIFIMNFIKVYRENQKRKLRAGKLSDVIDPFSAAAQSTAFLQQYLLREDLTLGSGDWDTDSNGACRFVARATANFLALPAELQKIVGNLKDN